MSEILKGLPCLVWVDDIVIYANSPSELCIALDRVLQRLEDVGLFVAAHKCSFFATEIKWCGKVYSGRGVAHDPDRVQGLANMRRPESAGELMQFLQAVNWLRTSLPRMAETVDPLQSMLEEHLVGNSRRTERVASNRRIEQHAWTDDRMAA